MRYIFFAERQAGKLVELEGIMPKAVIRIGVTGAGTMGAGIVGACLRAGFDVVLADPDGGARERAAIRIKGILRKARAHPSSVSEPGSLNLADSLAALSDCELIIEAVFEDSAVKSKVLSDLAGIARADAVLATNTSYLDINQLAAITGRAGDLIGLHFFAPAEIMRLVEVIRTSGCSHEALATGLSVARRLGKLPVVAGVCDGFIGNRILSVYRREMEYALEDGALPWEIDTALEEYGFAMGPFAVSDLSGLDIAWARRKRLAAARNRADRYVRVADRLCEMARFGRKTGSGWYRYEDGKRLADPVVAEIITEERHLKGITPRPVGVEEIQARARAVIVNEGARILEEGVAATPGDIDLVMINGYGYPAWRGGPLFDADRLGLAAVWQDLVSMSQGDTGSVHSELLRILSEKGSTFEKWQQARTHAESLTRSRESQ